MPDPSSLDDSLGAAADTLDQFRLRPRAQRHPGDRHRRAAQLYLGREHDQPRRALRQGVDGFAGRFHPVGFRPHLDHAIPGQAAGERADLARRHGVVGDPARRRRARRGRPGSRAACLIWWASRGRSCSCRRRRAGIAPNAALGGSITVNISTPNAQSFLKSESQIAAMLSRALAKGRGIYDAQLSTPATSCASAREVREGDQDSTSCGSRKPGSPSPSLTSSLGRG